MFSWSFMDWLKHCLQFQNKKILYILVYITLKYILKPTNNTNNITGIVYQIKKSKHGEIVGSSKFMEA